MLTPESEDVGLDGASRRSVVVKSSDAAVDLERRNVEESALESVGDGLSEGLSVDSDVH